MKTKNTRLLVVEILEAKPNKMFTEDQQRAVRFLRYNRWIACAECGKKRKVMWTLLCEFVAHNMGPFTLRQSGKVHAPLTPVCGEHPLGLPSAKELRASKKQTTERSSGAIIRESSGNPKPED